MDSLARDGAPLSRGWVCLCSQREVLLVSPRRRDAPPLRGCRQFSKPPVSHFTLCLWSRSVTSLEYLMPRCLSAGNAVAPRAASYLCALLTGSQVLALPSEVITAVPPSSERPASAYKAAVDTFTRNQSGSGRVAGQGEKETSLPDVPESKTQLLQQLMASAKTLTAREDLLNTLRLDSRLLHCFKLLLLPLVLFLTVSPTHTHPCPSTFVRTFLCVMR